MRWILVLLLLSVTASADLSGNGLYDYQGKPLTTNLDSGTRNPLDVETMFGGSIVDPRARTWTLSSGSDSCSAVQNGAWTTGRTWTLSNGSDSIASVQSGSWTVTANQGTPGPTASPWPVAIASPLPLPITGSVSITSLPSPVPVSQSGTWTVGQGTPGPTASPWPVTVTALPSPVPVSQSGTWTTGRTWTLSNSTDSVSAVQSGSWTVQQGTPPWSVVGNVASGATDSGSPVKSGTIFNTTQPTVTNGQRVDMQGTSRGGLIVATGVDNFNINNVSGTVSLPTGASTSANQTNGTQKTQVVDASGNVQPSGDVLTRKIFVQPTDGSNNQGYTGSNEAKVLVTPLTNSSVVKAQLQDNGGTAITLGQKVMSSSLPVVLSSDQTGINTFLDKSGTGTISALNGAVTLTTNGMSTLAISAQGTFVATLQVQGQAGDGAWDTVLGYLPGSGTVSTVLTGPSMLIFPIGGFSSVRLIAIAYTSGTANIQWNLGSGIQGVQAFNLIPASLQATVTGSGSAGTPSSGVVTIQGIASGTVVPSNVSQLGGNAINLGAGATSTGTLRVAANSYDGSGNAQTSTTISGTAANKQPSDVNPLSTGTLRYFTSFSTQQSATTAANAAIFSMRNAAASTKTVIVENVVCRQGFNATNPVTRTQEGYLFQRFSAATPTGGTALTAGQGDSSDAASQVTDIRFLDTGLTTTGVTFVANTLAEIDCDTTQGIACIEPILQSPSAWKFAPGEGLVIRLATATVIGVTISCHIGWREQ